MQQQIFYSVKGSRFQEIQDELFSGDLALYDPRVTFGALLEDARFDQKSESISDCILISALKRTFPNLNGCFRT